MVRLNPGLWKGIKSARVGVVYNVMQQPIVDMKNKTLYTRSMMIMHFHNV